MPKTKLHKDYKPPVRNYLPQTPTAQAAKDSIMDDFDPPDELNKHLEYMPQQKKRQLAQEHAERKLRERLSQINSRLKEGNTKVTIQRIGESVCLQATLPLKPDEVSKTGNPNKQTKISLGIPFSLDGLLTAEEEARELGTLIARKTFSWNDKYLRTKSNIPEVAPTTGQLLEQFEDKYFLCRPTNRQSQTTFKNHLRCLKRYLPLDKPLTDKLIEEVIKQSRAATAKRRQLVIALSVFCKTFKYNFCFDGYKAGYKSEKRLLPSDKEIEDKYHNFELYKGNSAFPWRSWRWIYGMLATYGLRPHEVFAIDLKAFTNPNNKLHELKLDESITEGVKTGERTIYPLHPHWVELFDLKNVQPLETDATFDSRTKRIAHVFKIKKIGFQPYYLRHCYAVRGYLLNMPLKSMADSMGHSPEMHQRTYLQHMDDGSKALIYEQAISAAYNLKEELSEVEQLKLENARLKAENQELRTILTKHQLDGLLSL